MNSGMWRGRLIIILVILFTGGISLYGYQMWTPGKIMYDGSHDHTRNGIWLQHGWLGDDEWFDRNNKVTRKSSFRNAANMRQLATHLKRHNITDVFPHLCPATPEGYIPPVDESQTELFLQIFTGFRVMPWVGGVTGVQAFPANPAWRENFTRSISDLLHRYPQFAGIHINIEPCRSGNVEYITLLQEVRQSLPRGKIVSIAAYPPPTLWHPFADVHWDKDYYQQVARCADQVVVMLYDTAIRFRKVYQYVIKSWTHDVLEWSDPASVLLGVPAYKDEGTGYHLPAVENLANALPGIHAGLRTYPALPRNYQGIAVYCEWEMDEDEWRFLRERFLKPQTAS